MMKFTLVLTIALATAACKKETSNAPAAQPDPVVELAEGLDQTFDVSLIVGANGSGFAARKSFKLIAKDESPIHFELKSMESDCNNGFTANAAVQRGETKLRDVKLDKAGQVVFPLVEKTEVGEYVLTFAFTNASACEVKNVVFFAKSVSETKLTSEQASEEKRIREEQQKHVSDTEGKVDTNTQVAEGGASPSQSQPPSQPAGGQTATQKTTATETKPPAARMRYEPFDAALDMADDKAIPPVGSCEKFAVHCAVTSKDIEKLKVLAASGKSMSERDETGFTPLMRAVILGWEEGVVQLALTAKPSSAEVDTSGRNALHYAAIFDASPKILLALKGWIGANTSFYEQKDKTEQNTPHHYAARYSSFDRIVHYESKTACVENARKNTPLGVAITTHDKERVSVLVSDMLQKGTKCHRPPVLTALEYDVPEAVEVVWTKFDKPTLWDIFRDSSRIGARAFDALIEVGLKKVINSSITYWLDSHAVHLAAEKGTPSLVAVLKKHGADFSKSTACYNLSEGKIDWDTVGRGEDSFTRCTFQSVSVVDIALRHGHVEFIEELKKADVPASVNPQRVFAYVEESEQEKALSFVKSGTCLDGKIIATKRYYSQARNVYQMAAERNATAMQNYVMANMCPNAPVPTASDIEFAATEPAISAAYLSHLVKKSGLPCGTVSASGLIKLMGVKRERGAPERPVPIFSDVVSIVKAFESCSFSGNDLVIAMYASAVFQNPARDDIKYIVEAMKRSDVKHNTHDKFGISPQDFIEVVGDNPDKTSPSIEIAKMWKAELSF